MDGWIDRYRKKSKLRCNETFKMKFATNQEHIIKKILVGAWVKRATSKKDSSNKVMVCFRNNIAPFLANKKGFRSGLRCIFESHWIIKFFNKIVYFKSNTAEEIEINRIL